MLAAGTLYLRLDRPADALTLAQKALAHDGRNAKSHFLAGIAAAALRRPSEAVPHLEQAFALDPQNVAIRRTLDRVRGLGSRTATPLEADLIWLLR
jgi:tetratricopeptide (TPR) repeat protein